MNFRRRICRVKPPNVPDITWRKSTHFRERPSQIRGYHFDHGVAPAVRLLFLHNPASDVPVEQDGIVRDSACSRCASADDAGFQFFDKLLVVSDGSETFFNGRAFTKTFCVCDTSNQKVYRVVLQAPLHT